MRNNTKGLLYKELEEFQKDQLKQIKIKYWERHKIGGFAASASFHKSPTNYLIGYYYNWDKMKELAPIKLMRMLKYPSLQFNRFLEENYEIKK